MSISNKNAAVQEVEKRIKRDARRLLAVGVAIGFLLGLAVGIYVGYSQGDRITIIPLREGIKT